MSEEYLYGRTLALRIIKSVLGLDPELPGPLPDYLDLGGVTLDEIRVSIEVLSNFVSDKRLDEGLVGETERQKGFDDEIDDFFDRLRG
jgi:hypothetical protein